MYLTLFLSPRGTLWECRYKAALLGSARYAFARYRYIKLNPVRARMVGSPIDSVGGAMRITHLAFNQPVITHHTAYLRLAGTATLRCERYRALVAEQVLREEIDEIRTYTTPMAARSSDSRSRR